MLGWSAGGDINMSSYLMARANSARITPRRLTTYVTTLFKISGGEAICGVKCIRHIPDHTGGKKRFIFIITRDHENMDTDTHGGSRCRQDG